MRKLFETLGNHGGAQAWTEGTGQGCATGPDYDFYYCQRQRTLATIMIIVNPLVMTMDAHLKSLPSHVEEDGAVRLALFRLA